MRADKHKIKVMWIFFGIIKWLRCPIFYWKARVDPPWLIYAVISFFFQSVLYNVGNPDTTDNEQTSSCEGAVVVRWSPCTTNK